MSSPIGPDIILASSSPRRKEFLAALGVPFRTARPRMPETLRPGEKPRAFALRMAREKARGVAGQQAVRFTGKSPGPVIIGADTIVVHRGRIMGKPGSRAEARSMLKALSGQEHQVFTGLCVRGRMSDGRWKERALAVVTRVTFKRLTAAELTAYLRTDEPMDMAGAYAIQGRAAFMVERIRGSYTNVVGLPMTELCEILECDFGCRLFRRSARR